MLKEPLTVLFYGPSGSGKGTQAKLLKEFLEKSDPAREAEYMETGELLRSFAKSEGHTQELVRGVMAEGGLLPSFLPVYLWTKLMIEQLQGDEHLILDGLARRVKEVFILDGALKFYGREDVHVISLELSPEEARERLVLRHRSDDRKDDAIQKRMEWYENDVVPSIQAFEELDAIVHHINGEPSIEEIHQEILKTLGLAGA